MNNRRKLIVALGAGTVTASLGAFAQQQGKVWRVGYLSAASRPASLDSGSVGAFSRGMRELGYIEGKNLEIQWRFAEGRAEMLPILAAELVKLNVDIIVTQGTPPTRAAQQATKTIPIVAASFSDPVKSGFAASLAHPGGNITGFENLGEELQKKRLELLISVAPKATRIAEMINPNNTASVRERTGFEAAAHKMGKATVLVEVRAAGELADGFSRMTRERAGALAVSDDALLNQLGLQIAGLALRQRLPSIFGTRQNAEAGGLMSYGADPVVRFRRAATYVDKILKGAKPGDLPIEQPTEFELVINMKTAKALGIKIPQSILVQATKVIE